MMRTSTRMGGGMNGGPGNSPGACEEWEMRPGGMLVQKRNPDSDRTAAPPPPTIRVRVKHGSIYHEISISSAASFGDLKKMLTGPTGLHHQDQKLIYKNKERDSKAFLDIVGVKDRSKMVLVEDPLSQERRFLEVRRNAKMDKASKSISEISLEIDRLAVQVSSLESIIYRGGGKVAETEVVTLIELLMNQLLKLDAIVAEGDVKLQRKMQVRRVQKYVEILDVLKIKNSTPSTQQLHSNGHKSSATVLPEHGRQLNNGHSHAHHPRPPKQASDHTPRHSSSSTPRHSSSSTPRNSTSGTVVTTQWETFDSSAPPLIPIDSTDSTTAKSQRNKHAVQPKFNWEFFE